MKISLRDNVGQIGQSELEGLLARLPGWRLRQALRYKAMEKQRESALAYLLLADALRENCGLNSMPEFAYEEHGKPILKDFPHIHFSLSHCKTAVLCVIDDHPVGADVEYIRSFTPGLLSYTMNQAECEEIMASAHPELTFTSLWTRKEALLKLTGAGVGSQMHDVLLPEHLEELGVRIDTFSAVSYVYSVAYFC